MRDCPQCGRPVDGLTCGVCGWGEKPGKVKVTHDPLRHCCEFMDQGQRCAHAGAISPNLRGGGPWYCRKHYDFVIRGWPLS